ncbi:hypothetical protein BGZ73_008783 [Actinomortierella ambigua]|nr:hypothetical protein BGZ73_008783 [Actinomortierella ambigua]
MGLYLKSSRCPQRPIQLLAAAGLSVSPWTIQEILRTLGKDARNRAQRAAKESGVLVVFDNFEMFHQTYDQGPDRRDRLLHGATATVIKYGSHSPLAYNTPVFRIPAMIRPSGQHFLIDCTDDHLERTFQFHFLDALKRHSDATKGWDFPLKEIDRLPVEKTEAYPLPAMPHNQSTLEGLHDTVEEIIENVGLDRKLIGKGSLLLAGDLFTVDRLRTLRRLRSEDVSPYHRLEWVIPVFQLFHLQMALRNAILNTHWGAPNIPGSLAYLVKSTGRRRVNNNDKSDHHAADQFLRHTFDAMILHLWEIDQASLQEPLGPQIEDDDLRRRKKLEIFVKSLYSKMFDQAWLGLQKSMDRNSLLFLRDMAVYIELGASIQVGDIGRIAEILGVITIMMQDAGRPKYALELLRLSFLMRHAWTDEWKKAVLSSMLVNPNGFKNSWIPTDLYQEHNNCFTKEIYAPKNSNNSWEYLANISCLARLLPDMKRRFEKAYGVSYSSNFHSYATAIKDVVDIKRVFERVGLLGHTAPILEQPPNLKHEEVQDLFLKGSEKLMRSDGIKAFVKVIDMDFRLRRREIPSMPVLHADVVSFFAYTVLASLLYTLLIFGTPKTLEAVKTVFQAPPKEELSLFKLQIPSIILQHGVHINSALMDMLVTGTIRAIITTPEYIFENRVFKTLWDSRPWRKRLMAVVLDEAHCTLDWGDTFRPFYSRLGDLRSLTSAPMVSVSATLAPKDVVELKQKLYLQPNTLVINIGNNRPNVYLEVRRLPVASLKGLRFVLDSTKTIIYVDKRISVIEVLYYLVSVAPNMEGKIAVYHSLMTDTYKARTMRLFAQGDVVVLISTEAAGMGCDIRHVDRVVQFKCPKTMKMSTLVQRLGRAARDGSSQGEAIVLSTGLTQPDCPYVRRFLSGMECIRALVGEYFHNLGEQHTAYTSRCCSFCEKKKQLDVRTQESPPCLHSITERLTSMEPSNQLDEPESADMSELQELPENLDDFDVQSVLGSPFIPQLLDCQDLPDDEETPRASSEKVIYKLEGTAKEKKRMAKEAVLRWRASVFETDTRLRIPWAVPSFTMEEKTVDKVVGMVLHGEPPRTILLRLPGWFHLPDYGENLAEFLTKLQRGSPEEPLPSQPSNESTAQSTSRQPFRRSLKRLAPLSTIPAADGARMWAEHLKKIKEDEGSDDEEPPMAPALQPTMKARLTRMAPSSTSGLRWYQSVFSGEDIPSGDDGGDADEYYPGSDAYSELDGEPGEYSD